MHICVIYIVLDKLSALIGVIEVVLGMALPCMFQVVFWVSYRRCRMFPVARWRYEQVWEVLWISAARY